MLRIEKSSRDGERVSPEVYEALYNVAPDAMLVLNERMTVILANARAVELFGYRRDELEGMNVQALVPPEHRAVHARHMEAFAPEAGVRPMGSRAHVTALKRDGSVVPVDIAVNPVSVGGTRFTIASVRDITRRLRLEQESRRLSDELRGAIQDVEQLIDLIPICVSCKRIRDDRGYWNMLESYLEEHRSLSFSHGICPKCVQHHYPEDSSMDEASGG